MLDKKQFLGCQTNAALHTLNAIKEAVKAFDRPLIDKIIEKYNRDPFLILISCLLSLRARDKVTYPVCLKLFSIAKTPEELLEIPTHKLENLIYSVGTYKRKAQILRHASKDLIERFNSKVPNDINLLLSIKGVGRKTANLVLSEAFNIPAICVDVHVHRIANCLGWVDTKTPDQTEHKLELLFPKNEWRNINHYLVMLGQNIRDIKSFCSKFKINSCG